MSHAVIDVTVVVRIRAYPSYNEDGDGKSWEQVKADAVAGLINQRVGTSKPTFWEWLIGYDAAPRVTQVKSSKLVEEIFDGE